MPGYLSDITVSNLMLTGEPRWDINVLNDICEKRDVELIKRIPLPMADRVDSWFWLLEEGGKFTVRSVYRWLQG